MVDRYTYSDAPTYMRELLSNNLLIAIAGGVMFTTYFSFLMWMTVDALATKKYLWLVFILGLPLVGAVVYFFVEKEHDYLKLSRTEQEE